MDPTKTTAKDRATSSPRVTPPAGATPPAKTRATTPAKTPRLRFLPGQCHFRNEAGRAVCKEPRPADKPSHLLCDRHEALWHAGKLRLTQAGTVRLLARIEAVKLDPTLRPAKKAAKPKAEKRPAKRTSTPAPQPARVAHPRNPVAPILEAKVVKVEP